MSHRFTSSPVQMPQTISFFSNKCTHIAIQKFYRMRERLLIMRYLGTRVLELRKYRGASYTFFESVRYNYMIFGSVTDNPVGNYPKPDQAAFNCFLVADERIQPSARSANGTYSAGPVGLRFGDVLSRRDSGHVGRQGLGSHLEPSGSFLNWVLSVYGCRRYVGSVTTEVKIR